MQCPKCAFANPRDMLFCGRCGTGLGSASTSIVPEPEPKEIFCPNSGCGAIMPVGATFCGVCGENLKAASSAGRKPSASTPPAASPPPGPAPAAVPSRTTDIAKASDTVDFQPGKPTASAQCETAELRSPDKSLREMVLIPAGWFSMGSPAGLGKEDEHPQHQVQLSAYYIDRGAVSNEEYEKFDPSHRRMRVEESLNDEDPVLFVSYQDCLDYCRWRAEQEGLPTGTYTLPTEAQWERAARGGYPGRLYPWGDAIDPEKCNTLEAGRNRTLPVNKGFGNGFHLCHMGSNVREWCLDFYSETYYDRLEARGPDPRGPAATLVVRMRVVRGACYQDPAAELSRCAARNYAHPKSGTSDIGFRCVRVLRAEELSRGTKKQ